jgi:hypothetical protein
MSEVRKKAVYIGAPACFSLELAIVPLMRSFDAIGCYVVGSCLERPDWRDVDVRMMLTDEVFAKEFPQAHDGLWECDTRWLLLTTAISEYLSKRTGLPIDFQFQPQTRANRMHPGARQALGLSDRIAPRVEA